MRRVLLALLCVTGGCAWTERENRPLWNAFEDNLVPGSEAAFWATLPLTVPVGLGAIVLDTLVVHPVQVMDDAWDDAAWLWRDGRPDFAGRYYSELAFLPVRAAVTPITFAGSFLGRSMFAVSPEQSSEERAEAARQRETKALDEMRAWIVALEAGQVRRFHGRRPHEGVETLAPDFARALASVDALARLELYWVAASLPASAGVVDVRQGLRDPDPIVRFEVLEWLSPRAEVAPQLIERLRDDPVEAVRLRARARWPD